MRKFLMMVAFLLFGVSARAQIQNVHEVAMSSGTCIPVTVSSTTATQMDNPILNGRFSVEVQNQDSSASLWCGFVAGEVSATKGRKIVAGSAWTVAFGSFSVDPGVRAAMHLYCFSDDTAGSSVAQVTQIR